MAIQVILDAESAERYGRKAGEKISVADYEQLLAAEKVELRGDRYVEKLNSLQKSIDHQQRLYTERIALAQENAKRRDNFAAELDELLDKETDRLPAGKVLGSQNGKYVIADAPVDETVSA